MSINPAFEAELAKLIGVEGGYSNHASDAGGATRYGITEATARAHGYTGPMAQLPFALAKDIYLRAFWSPLRLDEVCAIAGARVAGELFEQNVNLRAGQAGMHLQRALNAFNQRGTHYPDVTVDGQIGEKTLAALRAFVKRRGGEGAAVLYRALNSQQGAYYLERAENRPANEDFVFGWLAHRT